MHDTTLKKVSPPTTVPGLGHAENGWLPPMDVDTLQQQSPDRSSSPFPATANLTLETGGSLCLHVDVLGDGQGGASMGTGGGESFLLQAHRLDAGGGEPRVWGAVVAAGEDGERRRRELVALGGILRRPVGGRALDVAAVEEADGALSLSIKERVEKGKKLVLRTTRLGPAPSPGDSLGRALSGAAAQLARTWGLLEEAEREKAVLRGEHEKMQEVLRMRVADKDWVQSELLAKFNLVLNAKRAKIAELQERLRSKGERGAELEEGDDRRGAGGKPEGARTASKKKRGHGRESAVSQGPTGVGDEDADAKEGGGSGRRASWRRAPVRGGRGSAAGGGAGEGSRGGGEDPGGEGAEEGIGGGHIGHADVLPAPVGTTEVHGGLEELFKARRRPRSGSLTAASTGDGGRGDGRLPESKGDLGEHGAGRGGRTEFLGRREAPGRSAAPRATPGVTEELARTPKKSYGLLDSDSE